MILALSGPRVLHSGHAEVMKHGGMHFEVNAMISMKARAPLVVASVRPSLEKVGFELRSLLVCFRKSESFSTPQ